MRRVINWCGGVGHRTFEMLKHQFQTISVFLCHHENTSSKAHNLASDGIELPLQIEYITKTCLNNFDPLKPHFYIVKRVVTGDIIFSYSCSKT